MMAERLAEIRRDLDSEAYTSYLPKTVRELLDHIDELEERVSTLLFTNGVLDSVAKDAQAWSVRAQTAEAKCAQLEAQRGELARELDLTKREAWTAKERHKDEKDRADGLRERLDELNADEFVKAQRGGAVVVPEPTVKQWIKEVLDAAYNDPEPHATMRAAAKWFRENAKAIPADRVLGEGMVGVDREELMYLHAFEKYARKHGPESIQDVAGTLDHLRRAQQAKGE